MIGRRPRLGLSANFFPADPTRPVYKDKVLLYLDEAMSHWMAGAPGGALTYLVPTLPEAGAAEVADLVADLDGLVLQGGADVCPRTYGQEPMRPEWQGDERRDHYEIALIRAFAAAGKPVLGICRGAQIINVAFGGTLFQDIGTQIDTELVHRDWELYDENRHPIDLEPGGALAGLYPGVTRATVNTVHHQSVREVGAGLVVEARSSEDGVVEAVRLDDVDRFVLGVQWHPEWIGPRADLLPADPLRDAFVSRVRGVAGLGPAR